MGDPNDFEGLAFHGIKKGKEWGSGASPKVSAIPPSSCKLRSGRLSKVQTTEGKTLNDDDEGWRRIPNQQLALEAILEIWSVHERSWLRVRSKSLSDLTSSSGLLRKSMMGGFTRPSFLRDRASVAFDWRKHCKQDSRFYVLSKYWMFCDAAPYWDSIAAAWYNEMKY